jgi:hypothetical protein
LGTSISVLHPIFVTLWSIAAVPPSLLPLMTPVPPSKPDWTMVSKHKPATDPPRDLAGQITKDNEYLVVGTPTYGVVVGRVALGLTRSV